MAISFGRLLGAFGAAFGGFREYWQHADTPDAAAVLGADGLDAWGSWYARCQRYAIAWAYYQNDVFRHINKFAPEYKREFGLYKYARSIYNPVHRQVEFWATHLYGGTLDADAGDGKGSGSRSAIPILTEDRAVGPALAKLWKDSNFQVQKATLGRYGSLMGDVAIRLVDDPEAGEVRLAVTHPKFIRHVQWDGARRHILGYLFEEMRPDPTQPALAAVAPMQDPLAGLRLSLYTERVTLDGGAVAFETFRDGLPFDWPGNPQGKRGVGRWEADWGFVPLFLCQHVHLGLDWGAGSPAAIEAKVREVDDLASMLHDQIRKSVRPRWLYSGMRKPTSLRPDGAAPSRQDREPGRQEVDHIYEANADARATPLVADLQIRDTLEVIKELIAEIERDCPELAQDIWRAGDPSGNALRISRQHAEALVQERRAGYDEVLGRAFRAALAIGSAGGYDDYAGLPTDPKQVDLEVGPRPVFAVDELDRQQEQAALWANVRTAASAGVPTTFYLAEMEGWDDQKIEALEAAQVADAARANPDGLLTTQTNLSGTIGADGATRDPASGQTVPGNG